MAGKKQLIIPIFLPFAGCPERCVFCDQNGISGAHGLPERAEVTEQINDYLVTWKGMGRREVAFYGGSFTGLPAETQETYLKCVGPFLADGRIDGVRVSTRPDYVGEDTAAYLKGFGVDTVELGVQSMSDAVLGYSGRGHTATDTRTAVERLKSAGLRVGVQVMPGLPGDTAETVLDTIRELVELEPDFARIYPALVLKGTELERMYERGEYTPWGLDEMVELCREACRIFEEAGVAVIKVGLHPTEELKKSLVAGPFHPSFRQLL